MSDEIETVMSLAEEVAGLSDEIHVAFTKARFIGFTASCVVGGVGAGLLAGYFITKKMLEKKIGAEFDARLAEEVESTKRLYNTLHKVDIDPVQMAANYGHEVPVTPEVPKVQEPNLEGDYEAARIEETKRAAAQAFISYEKGVNAQVEPVEVSQENEDALLEQAIQRVFPDVPDEPDFSEEVLRRNEEEPYIISVDEFYTGEKNYSQNTITYFEGDDTLVDERGMPFEDVDAIVGEDNLTRFGQWSKDPNIVHIRNDHFQIDFEIVRSPGNYADEVGGFLEHSGDSRPRKFRNHRGDDE